MFASCVPHGADFSSYMADNCDVRITEFEIKRSRGSALLFSQFVHLFRLLGILNTNAFKLM
jgi:hypothetical protein